MTYRVPPAKILCQSISEVIRDKRMVVSQRRLTELVLQNLRRKDAEYKVSEERVRRMAIFKDLARVQINYRVTEERSDGGKCPVCGSATKELQNQTLDGEEVKLGFKCVRCPYWTGPNKRVPVRYTFLSLQEGVIEPSPKRRRKKDDMYSQWKFA